MADSVIIADSGSTKTAWALYFDNAVVQCETSGINPYYQTESEIADSIRLLQYKYDFLNAPQIYFYGAGCSNLEQKEKVRKVVSSIFRTEQVEIHHDLLGAARAVCGQNDGITCILGTGSNSCVFESGQITDTSVNLGFWLGDEGSGGNIGKNLLTSILKNQAPDDLIEEFRKNYQLSLHDILESAYQKPFPNRFFAQFSRFASNYQDHPFVKNLVKSSFQDFIDLSIKCFETKLPIYFVGSVAYFFKDILSGVILSNKLSLGDILQKPIEGLIKFHIHE